MTDETPFARAGEHSVKVACRVCGRTGYGPLDPDPTDPTIARSWQASCLAGHPFECVCGAKKSSAAGLANHVRLSTSTPEQPEHRRAN